MSDFLTLLYQSYIHPKLEDKTLDALSDFLQELPEGQGKRCVQVVERYAGEAFLLGVRTGAGLERYLQASPE